MIDLKGLAALGLRHIAATVRLVVLLAPPLAAAAAAAASC